MKYYSLLILCLLIAHGIGYGQSQNKNYIKTTTYLNSEGSDSIETIQYYDGLGRPEQLVQVGITPSGGSLVSLQEYDNLGRPSNTWLPALGNGDSYVFHDNIKNGAISLHGDQKPYSYPIYEKSPLNRVNEQYGPGNSWHENQKRVRTEYSTNGENDCPYYSFSGTGLEALSVTRNGYYAPNQLYVTESWDEDDIYYYKAVDKLGRLVCERRTDTSQSDPALRNVNTCYVYDDLDNLRVVLTPIAVDSLQGTWTENDDLFKKYVYAYKYDSRKNCIWKKWPGADPVYYVYDKANRLFCYQDGEIRKYVTQEKDWVYYLYDNFGRVVVYGCIRISKAISHGQLVDTVSSALAQASYTGGGSSTSKLYGYTLNSPFPVSFRPLAYQIFYYDNYNFRSRSEFSKPELDYEENENFTAKRYGDDSNMIAAKGLMTGTLIKMFDLSAKLISSVFYYDKRGNVIQSVSNNILGGYDRESVDYNFTNQVTRRNVLHTVSEGNDILQRFSYEYDHASRLTKTYYGQGNSSDMFLLAENEYDDLGRLKKKSQHNGEKTNEYEYNIRDWVTHISGDGFEEKIYYNEPTGDLNTIPRYNGNISKTSLKPRRGRMVYYNYDYHYDSMNRLTEARYANQSGSTLSKADYYNEEFTYDKMGGIKTLKRKNLGSYIDDLTFHYNGFQLSYIDDAAGSQNWHNVKEYHDLNSGTDDFAYDKNGRMIKDLDRDIVTIRYGMLQDYPLNLPYMIQFKNGSQIRNSYDVMGVKHKTEYASVISPIVVPVGQAVSTSGSNFNRSGTVYGKEGVRYTLSGSTPTLEAIYNSEGVYKPKHGYVFFKKDHLGSIMQSWRVTGDTEVQNMMYYPSGLQWPYLSSGYYHPYKYTGMELIDTHGYDSYDYHGRWRMAAIPVFETMDPMAEKYYHINPYAYCANNPMNAIDPDGRDVVFLTKSGGKTVRLTYTAQGTLQNSKGQTVNIKRDSHLGQIVDEYNKMLKSGNENYVNQVTTLIDSDNVHEIDARVIAGSSVQPGSGKVSIDEAKVKVMDGEGVGTTTKFNFGKDIGIETTNYTTVTHEVQHQFDFDQGNMKDAYDKNGKLIKGDASPAEQRAMRNEDFARDEDELKRRRNY